MTDPREEEPVELAIGGFSLRVLGREFPHLYDFWDSNWLNVEARMEAPGATVRTEGPLLRISDVESFAEALRALYSSLKGEAILESLEPNIRLALEATNLGHVKFRVSITGDHMSQSHDFRLELDQTVLPPLLAACEEVLKHYPMRGAPDD